MRFGNLKVGTRVSAMFGVTIMGYVALVAFLVITYQRSVNRVESEAAFVTEATDVARTAEVHFKLQVQEWKNMMLRGHDPQLLEKYTAQFSKEAREVQTNLAELKQMYKTRALKTDKLEAAAAQLAILQKRYQEDFAANFDPKDPLSIRKVDAAVRGIDRAPTEGLDDIVTDLQRIADADVKAAAAERSWLRTLAWVLSIALTIPLVLMGVVFVRSLVRPLKALVDALEKAAAGNLSQEIKLNTKDELGQVAKTFNQMVVRLRGQVQTEAERDEERRKRDELQQNIGRFLDVVGDMAQGDLTKRGAVSQDVLGNVVDSVNVMVGELGGVIKEVRQAAVQVASSSKEMIVSTGRMAVGVKAQTQEALGVSSSVEQMALSVRHVAENAEASAAAARQALERARKGDEAVRATLQGMQRIRGTVQSISKKITELGERSAEISAIVNTIEDIASQTNLLALNAAIEAAGAGEAGQRFAVVADEVRKLAERASQATKDIAGVIKNVQAGTQEAVVSMEEGTAEVEAGYRVAVQAGDSLKEIAEISQKAAELATDINLATQQQVRGAEGVATAVQSISTVAAQTEQGVAQTRQTVDDLARLADELTASLSRFKLAA